jgi:hypothetical protein
MTQHPVYNVHPPATRSKPASFKSHFLMVAPIVPLSGLLIWLGFEILPFIFSTLNLNLVTKTIVNETTRIINETKNETIPNSRFRYGGGFTQYTEYTVNKTINTTNTTMVDTLIQNSTLKSAWNASAWNTSASPQWECNQFLSTKYDNIQLMPNTWFRPLYAFLWMNTACGLIQVFQDDIKKKWKGWIKSDANNWEKSYGTTAATNDLSTNPLILKKLKKQTMPTIFIFNVIFFSISYQNFNLKIGTFLISVLFMYYYQYVILPLVKKMKDPNGAELDDNEKYRLKNEWFLKFIFYCLLIPLSLLCWTLIQFFGVYNIYNCMLCVVSGCIISTLILFVFYWLGFVNNISPWGYIGLVLIGLVLGAVSFSIIPSSKMNTKTFLTGCILYVVAGCVCTFFRIHNIIDNNIRNFFRIVRDYFFFALLFLVPITISLAVATFITDNYSYSGVTDFKGFVVVTVLMTIVWHLNLLHYIDKLLGHFGFSFSS